MDINRTNMNNIFQGFKVNFQSGIELVPETWKQFAMVIQSTAAVNIYPFLEQFGGMREWIGDRQIKNLASRKLEVKNRDFEDTVSAKRNDIEDDQYGIYANLISQMGFNAARIWQELGVDALASNVTWIDDKNFYAADRKYGKSEIANYSTSALSAETFAAAYAAMMSYQGHNDKLLGVVPDTLIVGPALRETAWNILKNEFTYSAADKVQIRNPNQNICELVILNELVGDHAGYWFLAQTKGVLKPVAVQQRKLPVLVRLDSEDDENVFMRNEYMYGTSARGAAFLTMPHLIYGGLHV